MATCIPAVGGVPGLSSPPAVLDIGNNPFRDPRWRGAVAQGFPFEPGAGVTEHVSFRGLYQTTGANKTLYLSWLIEVDTQLSNVGDRLYVGFQGPGGDNDSMVIDITPYNSAAADIDNQSVGSVGAIQVYQHTAANTWAPVAQPAWMASSIHVRLETGTNRWAVQMQVPIQAGNVLNGTGPNLPDPFRMWYYAQVAPLAVDIAHFAEWLAPVGTTHPSSNFQDIQDAIFPEPSTWDTFHLSTGSGDPVCTAEGIALLYNDIGTHNNPPSQINFNNTGTAQNQLFARPRNYTSAAISANTLHARFRIANWGSVADPAAPWDNIPGAGDVTNPAAIPTLNAGLDPPVLNPESIQFNWSPTSADLGGKPNHQCMLVELSGPGLSFRNNSVYRNMDFVPASIFRREAEISIRGLAPIGPSHRDVYLYVQTLNMPAKIEKPREPVPTPVPVPVDRANVVGRGDDNRPPPPPDFEEQQADLPTYRVHVFHSTGQTVSIGGRTREVLEAQSSFGYYLQHNGELAGWKHALHAPPEAHLQELSPNFYKVIVPNDGSITVTTAIEAVEAGIIGQFTGCLAVPVTVTITVLKHVLGVLEWIRDRVAP